MAKEQKPKQKIESAFESGEQLTEAEVQAVRALLQLFPIHNHDGRNSLPVATKKVRESILSQRVISPSDLIANENISNGEVVRSSSGTNQLKFIESLQHDTDLCFTDYDDRTAIMFKIVSVDNSSGKGIEKVKFKIRNVLDTSLSNITVNFWIETDDNGQPSGTQVSGSDGSVTASWNAQEEITLTVNYTTPVEISLNTPYWFVIKAGTDSNQLKLRGGGTSYPLVYNKYACVFDDQSTTPGVYDWTVYNTNAYFELYWSSETDKKVFKNIALSDQLVNLTLGVATTNSKSGDTVRAITYGFKTDFENLSTGSAYYIDDETPGLLTTTPGVKEKKVGSAITSKILLITI